MIFLFIFVFGFLLFCVVRVCFSGGEKKTKYLRNDSIIEMEQHSIIYRSVFNICKAMSRHNRLACLFGELEDQKTALFKLLTNLNKKALMFQNFGDEGAPSSSSSSSSSSVIKKFIHT